MGIARQNKTLFVFEPFITTETHNVKQGLQKSDQNLSHTDTVTSIYVSQKLIFAQKSKAPKQIYRKAIK